MVYSQGRGHWTDYTTPSNWQQRVWVEPAGQIPVVTWLVAKVRNYTGADPAVPDETRTVVTDHQQTDPEGVLLPGALQCDGQVYQAYGHTISGVLQVHILPHARPTDVSLGSLARCRSSLHLLSREKVCGLYPRFGFGQ